MRCRTNFIKHFFYIYIFSSFTKVRHTLPHFFCYLVFRSKIGSKDIKENYIGSRNKTISPILFIVLENRNHSFAYSFNIHIVPYVYYRMYYYVIVKLKQYIIFWPLCWPKTLLFTKCIDITSDITVIYLLLYLCIF